jgi:hypothetical protein
MPLLLLRLQSVLPLSGPGALEIQPVTACSRRPQSHQRPVATDTDTLCHSVSFARDATASVDSSSVAQSTGHFSGHPLPTPVAPYKGGAFVGPLYPFHPFRSPAIPSAFFNQREPNSLLPFAL